MFEKKCKNCGNKVERKFDYCPYCGNPVKVKKEIARKGLLDEEFNDIMSNFGMGGMSLGPFQGIMNNLMKELEEQMKMQGMDEEKVRKMQSQPKTQGISISVSTSENGEPVIKVNGLGDIAGMNMNRMPGMQQQIPQKQSAVRLPKKNLTKKQAENISKLPRAEPATNVRRLSDKVIYEIDLPGVKKENIIIHKMHNSIEIKAFTKDRAFFKLIPVTLPLMKYYMENGKLILELKPEM